MKKYIIITVVAGLLIAGLFYLFYMNKENTRLQASYQEQIKGLQNALSVNRRYNDSKDSMLALAYKKGDSVVSAFSEMIKVKKAEKEAITEKYQQLKDIIAAAPDSIQIDITKKLLHGKADYYSINQEIAKGQECCDNYSNVQDQANYFDSLQAAQKIQIINLNDRLFLSSSNEELASLRESSALQQLQDYSNRYGHEVKRKRTWRTLFFISTGIVAGYFTYNQIK